MTLLTEPTRIVLAKDSPATWAQGGDLQYEIEVSGTRYMVHEFRTVGTATLNVLKGGNIEYLVVAGGGGGGGSYGGSGGGIGGSGIVIIRYLT